MDQYRVPVLIDRELYNMYKTYSELTGIPVVRVIREALRDFQETAMEARIESMSLKTLDSQTSKPILPVLMFPANDFKP